MTPITNRHGRAASRKAYYVGEFCQAFDNPERVTLRMIADNFHKSTTWAKNYKDIARELGYLRRRSMKAQELLEAMEGQEILSIQFEGTVLVKGGKIIQAGEVIDDNPSEETLGELFSELAGAELGPDWEKDLLEEFGHGGERMNPSCDKCPSGREAQWIKMSEGIFLCDFHVGEHPERAQFRNLDTNEFYQEGPLCPRCKVNHLRTPEVLNALSRVDNRTYICSDCGTEEALVDFALSQVCKDLDALVDRIVDFTLYTRSQEPIQMKKWAAVYNKAGMTCCTIIAEDSEKAFDILKEQLTRNPSRRAFYEGWAENGYKVKLMD